MDGPGRVLRIPPGPSRCAGLRSTTEAATSLSPDMLKRHYRSLDMAIRQLGILRIRGDNRASFNDQGFRESSLIFCVGPTPADYQTAFKRLEEQSRELEAAQVETMGDIGGKKPLPATSPVSYPPKCSPSPPKLDGQKSGFCSCRWRN